MKKKIRTYKLESRNIMTCVQNTFHWEYIYSGSVYVAKTKEKLLS